MVRKNCKTSREIESFFCSIFFLKLLVLIRENPERARMTSVTRCQSGITAAI